jgi:RNA polymerase-binding transcription factor DksA
VPVTRLGAGPQPALALAAAVAVAEEGKAAMPLHMTEAPSLPRWRALLEARWQARLQQLTELSVAYHDAAAYAVARPGDHAAARRQRETLRRTVAVRRGLADVEEALARLAAGRFGQCEQCGAAIPASRLGLTPETRYCPACDVARMS